MTALVDDEELHGPAAPGRREQAGIEVDRRHDSSAVPWISSTGRSWAVSEAAALTDPTRWPRGRR